MSDSFYISTPIYYVNGSPHVGHAYTTLVADAFARHYRHRGRDVFFLTGTDEHGLKVQRAAEDQGVSPQQLVDENSTKFRELFDKMELTYDRFIRTTEEEHEEVVLDIIDRMKESGDIYLDKYEGWYSASDEAYYDDDEVEDGVAVATGSEVEWVEEDSYFFRLGDYEEELLEWYDDVDGSVAPEARRNEVRTFVDGGLHDLSITRTTFDWGITYPDDPEHVLYVWVDALINYLTGVGRLHDPDKFEKFWPCDIHLVGKDILRFHAVYWPAFLMSAGIELPDQVFAHGWWLVEGDKMSKSRGNWVDADELADAYDLDVLRYFFLRELPFGQDGNFARSRIVERNNTELADNYGNLVNRTVGMLDSYFDGVVPEGAETDEAVDEQLRSDAQRAVDRVCEKMDARQPTKAVEAAMELSGALNNYLQQTEPWALNSDDETERLGEVLYHTLEGIRWTSILLRAFIPDATAEVFDAFEIDADDADFSTLEWGRLEPGTRIDKPDVLFEKLEDESIGLVEQEDDVSDDTELVDFDTFTDLEFKVGVIEEAAEVEDADKLLKLTVDVGESDNRTVVAGIATSYDPDELVGLRLPFVTNLEPATIFGIESQAMLLAATVDDDSHALPTFDGDVPAGASIE